MLTEQEIAIIAERAAVATPGPWTAYDRDGGADRPEEISVCGSDIDEVPQPELDRGRYGRHADAEFIAAARADVPALIATVRELRAALERVREAVRVEHVIVDDVVANDSWVGQAAMVVWVARMDAALGHEDAGPPP